MTIVTEGLVKKFGDLTATDDISFEVQQGEVFGLLGPNGAGKTTLVRIISTLLRPDAGIAKVAGFNVATEAKEVRRSLGIVSDGMAIYEALTPSENLEFFGVQYGMNKGEIRKRREKLLDILDLTEFQHTPIKVFSTGMKRKAEIAVALIHDPVVLLCDEVTAGLDPQMAVIIRDFFRALAKEEGKTILWTTHYLTEPEIICDKVGILFKGRLAAIGTIQELKETIKSSTGAMKIQCTVPDDKTLALIRESWPRALVKMRGQQLEIVASWEQSNAIMKFLAKMDVSIYQYQPENQNEVSMEEIFISLIRSQATQN